MRLLELEFKSDNTIKPKAMKYIVNRYIYIYIKWKRIAWVVKEILGTNVLLWKELNKID